MNFIYVYAKASNDADYTKQFVNLVQVVAMAQTKEGYESVEFGQLLPKRHPRARHEYICHVSGPDKVLRIALSNEEREVLLKLLAPKDLEDLALGKKQE